MTKSATSAADLLQQATERLNNADNPLARRDSELLLCHVLGVEPARLPLYEQTVTPVQQQAFEGFIERRLRAEPVAHIIGEQEFWSLVFYVNEHTLVPRPDTEELVSAGLTFLEDKEAPSVADLGTGSGCVLLSLLHEKTRATGVGIDVSEKALAIAIKNANHHGLEARATFVRSNWFDALPSAKRFDLIVSNPPYIVSAEIETLMPDVRDFEPRSALDGGSDGLDCYRAIARTAKPRLVEDGMIALEVGMGQAADVAQILSDAGLAISSVQRDLAGIERVVCAKNAGES